MKRKGKYMTDARLKSVTRFLFLTTQICALVWVFISYGLAIYATLKLGEVYTMAELSEPAIKTLLGVTALKVVGNVFEHNDGGLFGQSKTEDDTTTTDNDGGNG